MVRHLDDNPRMLKWWSSSESQAFGSELARFLLAELSDSLGKGEAKFAGKVEKVLLRADQRIAEFKRQNSLNFFQRAKLANTFLWKLKDGGCSEEYATKLTEWLSMRL